MRGEPRLRERLETVSPTTFSRLKAWQEKKGCGLQLLWEGEPPLAPFPAAKLGDVVHKVMEAVDTNHDPASVWDDECAKVNEKLSESPVTRGLAPLSQTVKGFELRRLMTIRMARTRAAVLHANPAVHETRSREHPLKEEMLRSLDGMLRGQFDLVERRPEGWVLVDYKSGDVLDVEGDGTAQIKESYQLQLLLYAALLAEVKGIRIHKALLKTLDGWEHEVPIDPAQAVKVARQARQLLDEFNKIVKKDSGDLARPLPKDNSNHIFGCMGCLYRPVCKSYLNTQRLSEENKKWPNDAVGLVTNLNKGYDKVRITIKPRNEEREITIEFRDSPSRHQAFEKINAKDSVGIFDYVSGRTANYGGPRTCVYKMNT